jgi:hypothetical protein
MTKKLIKVEYRLNWLNDVINSIDSLYGLIEKNFYTDKNMSYDIKSHNKDLIDEKYLDGLFSNSYKLRLSLSPINNLHLALSPNVLKLVVDLNNLVITKDRFLINYKETLKNIYGLLPDLKKEINALIANEKNKLNDINIKKYSTGIISCLVKYFHKKEDGYFT